MIDNYTLRNSVLKQNLSAGSKLKISLPPSSEDHSLENQMNLICIVFLWYRHVMYKERYILKTSLLSTLCLQCNKICQEAWNVKDCKVGWAGRQDQSKFYRPWNCASVVVLTTFQKMLENSCNKSYANFGRFVVLFDFQQSTRSHYANVFNI